MENETSPAITSEPEGNQSSLSTPAETVAPTVKVYSLDHITEAQFNLWHSIGLGVLLVAIVCVVFASRQLRTQDASAQS
jgi:hypothetical protein